VVKQPFPPSGLDDLDLVSAGAVLSLVRSIRTAPITLVLGSGVSASAGLPIWKEFLARVCSVFFQHWEFERSRRPNRRTPPHELSIAFWEEFFWSDESVRLARELASGDPLLVAQQIKNCVREKDWRYLLNKTLYSDGSGIVHSETMASLAGLCGTAAAVAAVVNFNYDSLFETYLHARKITHSVVWSPQARLRVRDLCVLHPHGYLRLGGGPVTPLILAEEDYLDVASARYGWVDTILSGYLSQTTCLFVGHSMTDPNVRRLLRATRALSGRRHFAFLPRATDESTREALFRSLFDRDLVALGVRPIRFPLRPAEEDAYARLPELINLVVASLRGEAVSA
jgi:hypothetical protein